MEVGSPERVGDRGGSRCRLPAGSGADSKDSWASLYHDLVGKALRDHACGDFGVGPDPSRDGTHTTLGRSNNRMGIQRSNHMNHRARRHPNHYKGSMRSCALAIIRAPPKTLLSNHSSIKKPKVRLSKAILRYRLSST